MLNQNQFNQLFPFHLRLADDLRVKSAGSSVLKVCADLPDRPIFDQAFGFEYPVPKVALDRAWFEKHQNQLFLIKHLETGLLLRGQFLVETRESTDVLFLGSPWLTNPDQLETFHLSLHDFALHDPMMDLLQLSQSQSMALEDSKRLSTKLTGQRADLRAANEELAEKNKILVETAQQLRAQEAETRKLAHFTARTGNGMILTDASGHIEWVNEGFTRLTGYELEEVRGLSPGAFLQGPATQQKVVEEIRRHLAKGKRLDCQLINYDKAGHPYVVQLEILPMRDDAGVLTNFMAIQSDVTEHVCSDQLRTLSDAISRTLADEEILENGLTRALETIARNLDFQIGISWEVNRNKGRDTLVKQFSWHVGGARLEEFDQANRNHCPGLGEGLVGRVWQTRKMEWIRDVSEDRGFLRLAMARKADLVRVIAFPVEVHGNVIGVMEFFGGRHFLPNPGLPDFFQSLGRQIGLFVARCETHVALRQERDFATQVMGLMGQGIVVTGADRRIEYCNNAFAQLLGRDTETLIGENALGLISEDQRRKFSQRWWYENSRSEAVFESEMERNDGTKVIVLITSVPRIQDGRRIGHIATFTDLSQQKRDEKALRDAKEAAEEANKAKSYFLATMSHEIRTPMNAIMGMTGLLKDTSLNAHQKEFVELVYSSSESLLLIINDVLDFSKIESNALILEEQEFDLENLIESVMELMALRAHEKHLELNAIIEDGVPLQINGDPGRLRQILVNLVSNAVKFTTEGEVLLRVCVVQDGNEEMIRFSIRDDGIGISAEQQAKIFDPFVQADSSETRNFGGTGLGLAISKRLVGLLGGTISVNSAPGEGSDFWFTIPALAAAEQLKDEYLDSKSGWHALVISKHRSTIESLESITRTWGLFLMHAGSMEEGLGILSACAEAEAPIGLALLDVHSLGLDTPDSFKAFHSAVSQYCSLIVVLQYACDAPLTEVDPRTTRAVHKPLKRGSVWHSIGETTQEIESAGHAAGAQGESHQTEVSPAADTLRILIAEDHEINQRFARFMLEKLGYTADFAQNGREAVEAVQARPYDVIFMDCQMPIMDGYDATRAIREYEAGHADRHALIIAMTAHVVSENKQRCLDSGMDGFIAKPVRSDQVKELLEQAKQNRRSQTGVPPIVIEAPAQLSMEQSISDLRREYSDEIAKEMIDAFLQETPQKMADIVALNQKGDFEGAAKLAHKLAGLCGILGLAELRTACMRIESCHLAGDTGGVSAAVANAREASGEAIRQLKAMV